MVEVPEPKIGDVYWHARAEVRAHKMRFSFGDVVTSHDVQIQFEKWYVVRVTPATVLLGRYMLQPWEAFPGCGDADHFEITEDELRSRIKYKDGATRRQLKNAHSHYAWPTKELALNSLRIRSTYRVKYAKSRLEEAEAALEEASKDIAEIKVIEV